MATIVQDMKLQDILKRHNILAAGELRRRIPGMSVAQASNLWRGKSGVGKETMRALHDHLGIPYEELMEVDPVPHKRTRASGEERPTRGRPRKRPEPEGGAA
jgi:hypothetical protein